MCGGVPEQLPEIAVLSVWGGGSAGDDVEGRR